MQAVKPHMLMLELCDSRTGLLVMREDDMLEEYKSLSIGHVRDFVQKNGVYWGLTDLLLLNLNKHIAKEIGMAPGGEFRVAFQEVSCGWNAIYTIHTIYICNSSKKKN